MGSFEEGLMCNTPSPGGNIARPTVFVRPQLTYLFGLLYMIICIDGTVGW